MKELRPEGCQTRVYGDRDIWGHQCSNKPVVTRESKLYCKIHDPEYIKAKREKQEKKWDAKWAAKEQMYSLENAREKATTGLTLIELNRVTPELIRKALAKVDKVEGK